MPPEDRVICLLCRRMTKEDRALLKSLLGQSLDWAYLKKMVTAHEITSLAYINLKPFEAKVPKSLMADLKELYLDNLSGNMELLNETKRLSSAFERRQVKVVSVKGPVLAEQIYGDSALRNRPQDIDLFISVNDFEAAEKVLAECGYGFYTEKDVRRPYFRELRASKKLEGSATRHLKYGHPKKMILLELHWALTAQRNGLKVDWNRFYENTVRFSQGGTSIEVLAPAYHLVYLCLNFAVNDALCYSLKNLTDIDRAVKRLDFDWDNVIRLSMEFNAASRVYFGLWLARELLATSVPDTVLQRLRPGGLSLRLFSLVKQHFLGLRFFTWSKWANFLIRNLLKISPSSIPF